MDYKSSDAWQACDDLAVAVYQATEEYPGHEQYGLISQMRRAAVSSAANVAEGYGRATVKDLLRFLYQARGSLYETEYFIHLSGRLGYLHKEEQASLSEKQAKAARLLQGLVHHWEKQRQAGRTHLAFPKTPDPSPKTPIPRP